MIRLATIFSGIGSIEWALKRMNVDYKIVFACDNGDIELKDIDEEEVKKKMFSLKENKTPIIGDRKYGNKRVNEKLSAEFSIKNQVLLSYKLVFLNILY